MSDTLSLHITGREQFIQLWMPFLDGGGLFVPTRNRFSLGQTVTLQVRLPGNPELFTLQGDVAWLTPQGAQGNRPAGVGIRLGDECPALKLALERLLAEIPPPEGATATL